MQAIGKVPHTVFEIRQAVQSERLKRVEDVLAERPVEQPMRGVAVREHERKIE